MQLSGSMNKMIHKWIVPYRIEENCYEYIYFPMLFYVYINYG